jgi:hypothetical protein
MGAGELGRRRRGLIAALVAFQIIGEPARALKISASPGGAQYQVVDATPSGQGSFDATEVVNLGKYLIASFPNLKQVAYCMLPDNVWRPLVIGDVTGPKGVAADQMNKLLFVADPSEGKVYKYRLSKDADGLLQTDGVQQVALDGFAVSWMAVNSLGDLYFTGKAEVESPASSYDAVFRVDASLIASGNKLSPKEIYTRSNSGSPFPNVWLPSGIAVDSFYIYWGNQERGTQHGSVIKGNRMNVLGRSAPSALQQMNAAHDEVRGMTTTGTSVFYLTTGGVYGVPKVQGSTITDPTEGLVAPPPGGGDLNDALNFDPKSIAWDGDTTAYLTDYTAGKVYSIPTTSLRMHNLSLFVDAPGVYGMTFFSYESSHLLNSGSTADQWAVFQSGSAHIWTHSVLTLLILLSVSASDCFSSA